VSISQTNLNVFIHTVKFDYKTITNVVLKSQNIKKKLFVFYLVGYM
jgi:hypothetical protein